MGSRVGRYRKVVYTVVVYQVYSCMLSFTSCMVYSTSRSCVYYIILPSYRKNSEKASARGECSKPMGLDRAYPSSPSIVDPDKKQQGGSLPPAHIRSRLYALHIRLLIVCGSLCDYFTVAAAITATKHRAKPNAAASSHQ